MFNPERTNNASVTATFREKAHAFMAGVLPRDFASHLQRVGAEKRDALHPSFEMGEKLRWLVGGAPIVVAVGCLGLSLLFSNDSKPEATLPIEIPTSTLIGELDPTSEVETPEPTRTLPSSEPTLTPRDRLLSQINQVFGELVGQVEFRLNNHPIPLLKAGWGPQDDKTTYGLRFLSVFDLPKVFKDRINTPSLWKLPVAGGEASEFAAEGVEFTLDSSALLTLPKMHEINLPSLPRYLASVNVDSEEASSIPVRKFIQELIRIDEAAGLEHPLSGLVQVYDFRPYCIAETYTAPDGLQAWQRDRPDIDFLVAVVREGKGPNDVELRYLLKDYNDNIVGYGTFSILDGDILFVGLPSALEDDIQWRTDDKGVFLLNQGGELKYLLLEMKFLNS